MPSHSSILLIEDSPGECELFRLALVQTGLDVALYTEHDAEAAFYFLEDRAHHSQWSLQARSFTTPEGGLNRSPTARTISPAQPSADFSPTYPRLLGSRSPETRFYPSEVLPILSTSI